MLNESQMNLDFGSPEKPKLPEKPKEASPAEVKDKKEDTKTPDEIRLAEAIKAIKKVSRRSAKEIEKDLQEVTPGEDLGPNTRVFRLPPNQEGRYEPETFFEVDFGKENDVVAPPRPFFSKAPLPF